MLEKFELKIIEIKNKISPRKKAVGIFAFFGIIIVILMNYINIYGREKIKNSDSLNRAMYQVITNINTLDSLVTKLRVTKTNEYNIKTLSEMLAEANSAKNSLTVLPVSQEVISPSSKLLSQVMGYSMTLINKIASGENLDDKDYQNLENINKTIGNLKTSLDDIYVKLTKGKIKWDEVEKLSNTTLDNENLKLEGVANIKKSLSDYEGLIYDGAFSSHLENEKPKMLNGKNISSNEAKEKVIEVVEKIYKDLDYKKQIKEIIYNGEVKGKIDVYTFDLKFEDTNDTMTVNISKNSGYLILLLLNRKVEKKSIEIKDAEKIGDSYLKELGLDEFTKTYFLEEDNMVTINYAAVENDVILYPDLIKIKIALDTGEICSFESMGYIFNHTKRDDLTPIISKEDAINSVYQDIQVESVRLAVIPTESKKEILTYELKGKVNDNIFLIYVNAMNKKEENVLILLETKGGYLTI